MTKRKSRAKINTGFTLIELLVVISIIALLSSIVLTSVNSARAKARNAREKAEVRQIITALELARSNSSDDKYPLSAAGGVNWSCFKSSGSCWRGNYSALPAQALTDLAPYLPALPSTAVNAPSGCYANDSYLYLSSYVGNMGTFVAPPGPNAYIIWAKETTGAFEPGECPGYDAAYDCGLRYCYQYIGAN